MLPKDRVAASRQVMQRPLSFHDARAGFNAVELL